MIYDLLTDNKASDPDDWGMHFYSDDWGMHFVYKRPTAAFERQMIEVGCDHTGEVFDVIELNESNDTYFSFNDIRQQINNYLTDQDSMSPYEDYLTSSID